KIPDYRAIWFISDVGENMVWRGKSVCFAALAIALLCAPWVGAADSAESLVRDGDGFLKDRNIPAAIEAYRKAVQLKPDLEIAHQGLITALANAGKLDEAARGAEEMVGKWPKNPLNHR